jgi:hypothetical protein
MEKAKHRSQNSKRCSHFYSLEISVTGCETTLEIQTRIAEALEDADFNAKSFVKLVLVGEYDVECEKNVSYLHKK